MFFNDFIRPLKDKGKTIMIIHHLKKGNQDEMDDEDLDVFRGSGDFVAEVDMAYKILKSDTNEELNSSFMVSIIPSKNRLGIPIKTFTFSVVKDDANFKTIFKFTDFKKMPSKVLRAKDKLKLKIIEYLRTHKIADRLELFRIISAELGTVKTGTPDRYLKELMEDGIIEQPSYGKYSLKSTEIDSNPQTSRQNNNSQTTIESF
jgi:hypothetical protein